MHGFARAIVWTVPEPKCVLYTVGDLPALFLDLSNLSKNDPEQVLDFR